MNDSALEWNLGRLSELRGKTFPERGLSGRVTMITPWLWMDERFDSRLDGLLAAVLQTWSCCGRLPVVLVVNRITPMLEKMSSEWELSLVVRKDIRGGGGNVKDLNRNVLLHMSEWFYTEYALTFQDHAFPLRPGLEEFLGKWDYIGAPWPFGVDDWITRMLLRKRGHVGNGAFTLRSRNLCERVAYYYNRHYRMFPHCYLFNDDYFIGKTLPSWERNYVQEVKIASPCDAARFSFENNRELQDDTGTLPFGFHGPDAFSYLFNRGLIK